MEFRLLGPLEVVDEGRPLVVGRPLERALLAYLLLHANEPVSADRLVDELWGPSPPRTATASLQNRVSGLRRLLGRERIELGPAGYVLRVDPEQFDLARFERLVAEASSAKPKARAELLRAALALWRGPPLADLAFEEFAQAEIAQLGERYIAAIEERIDADLQLGAGGELVEELAELIAEHPLRERLRAQLMLALYRAGRQAEALQVYQEARRMLDQELGLEPSADLRELQQRVLRHDPALQARTAATEPPESRRTVSVLFCDLVGSTRLATSLDPEAYRRLIAGYLDAASCAIEAHGGVIEKNIGDAVMAVFGAPELHEDDALRAVRAAIDARAAVAALEEHDLAVRIGVNTGEVVVSATGLVTGATVNLAAHLEQRAGVNGIVLGEQTHRLVRDAVRAEPADLGNGLHGWRLDQLLAGMPGVARRFEVALVGREQELRTLRGVFERARSERSCEIVTVVGEPGIGKTRIAAELAAVVRGSGRVLGGSCVAYGAGATYLPLATIVREAAPAPSPAGIASVLGGADDAGRIAQVVAELIGIAEAPASPDEAFWAVRRLLEAIAYAQPLLLVLDDVHWAEATLLDLVEYVGEWAEAPILVLCLARPELLEQRPGWGGPSSTGFVLELAPLAEDEVGTLLEELADGPLLSGQREQIVERAGGNPLFAEQLLAFAGEAPETTLERAPPTVEAVIATLLERLPRSELDLLRRASVIGSDFSKAEVSALGPVEDGELRALERRGLIHPLASLGEFRFHHVLVRDVAYRGIAKAERAVLHERAAEALDLRDGPDELVGYHLEQAARYRQTLGRPDRSLEERAGDRLAIAGRRALSRIDTAAAASLFQRALELTRPFRLDVHLELELSRTLWWISPEQAVTVAEVAADRAAEAGDEAGATLARLAAARCETQIAGEPDFRAMEALARQAIPMLEEVEDHAGLVDAWWALGWARSALGSFEGWEQAGEQVLIQARLAGQDPNAIAGGFDAGLVYGPKPADEALHALETVLPDTLCDLVLMHRAKLLAMLGRFEEAWPLARDAIAHDLERSGSKQGALTMAEFAVLAGDDETAIEQYATACECAREHGTAATLSTAAPAYGRLLCAQGRYDEAEPLAELGRTLGGQQDVVTQGLWRQVQALVEAHRGEHTEAERLAREAVVLAEQTDGLVYQGDAFFDLAEVLEAAGRTEEAASALEQALERYERKRVFVMTERARTRLAELRRSPVPAGSR